jgi:ABC-type lipoprotein export system ATPase subunit
MVSLVQRQVTEGTTVVSVTHDPTYVEVLGEHHIRVGS